jgi:hypothetical protein
MVIVCCLFDITIMCVFFIFFLLIFKKVRESNLYKTDYHTWNKEQMLTFLTKVERIPKEYAEHIVAGKYSCWNTD